MNALRVSLDKHAMTGTRIAVVASGLIAGEHFVKTDDCNPGSSHCRSAFRLRDRATHQDQQHKHGRQHKHSKRSAYNACTNGDDHAAETGGRSADDAALACCLLRARRVCRRTKIEAAVDRRAGQQLKGIARQETAKLRESDSERSAGTAKAARVEASEQIKAVVGEQKLHELTAFLNDRWNGNAGPSTTVGVAELRYETITVEDGKLHIYRDVYDHGTNTEGNLRNVLQAYGVTADQLTPNERAQVMRGLSQMARDATGKPSEADGSTPKKNPTGKVTRAIKGAKEVIIEIVVLAGKGYPAPVDLDTGIPPKKTVPRRHKK